MKKLLSEFLGTFAIVFAGTGAIVINPCKRRGDHASGYRADLRADRARDDLYLRRRERGALQSCGNDGFRRGAAIPLECSAWLCDRATPRCLRGERPVAFSFPGRCDSRRHAGCGHCAAAFRPRNRADLHPDASNSQRLNWCERKGITAGIAIGAVIALEALFAGPICGASMNPARSL